MVESKLVELVVAGSNPVGHPIFDYLASDSSKSSIVEVETFGTRANPLAITDTPR